jgi:hypothetical protein
MMSSPIIDNLNKTIGSIKDSNFNQSNNFINYSNVVENFPSSSSSFDESDDYQNKNYKNNKKIKKRFKDIKKSNSDLNEIVTNLKTNDNDENNLYLIKNDKKIRDNNELLDEDLDDIEAHNEYGDEDDEDENNEQFDDYDNDQKEYDENIQYNENENNNYNDDNRIIFPGYVPIALKYFNQSSKPRYWCLQMITSPWFERISMLAILINCITLGMYQPCNDNPCSSTRCVILQYLDHGIFIFFAVEMAIKIMAMGFFGHETYMAETWNRLDFFIVVAG